MFTFLPTVKLSSVRYTMGSKLLVLQSKTGIICKRILDSKIYLNNCLFWTQNLWWRDISIHFILIDDYFSVFIDLFTWRLIMSSKMSFLRKFWQHWLLGYLTPSWAALWCLAWLALWENCWTHCPLKYLTPPWSALLCSARHSLLKIVGWIACKDTWLLHVLPFCV